MANLTGKELSALEDQLGFEKLMVCKYQDAARNCTEQALRTKYQTYAASHKQHYETLLNFLK